MCEQVPLRSLHDLLQAMIDALSQGQACVENYSLGEDLRFAREVLASSNEERVFRQLRHLALTTQAVRLEEAPGIREVYAEIARVMHMGGVSLPIRRATDSDGSSTSPSAWIDPPPNKKADFHLSDGESAFWPDPDGGSSTSLPSCPPPVCQACQEAGHEHGSPSGRSNETGGFIHDTDSSSRDNQ